MRKKIFCANCGKLFEVSPIDRLKRKIWGVSFCSDCDNCYLEKCSCGKDVYQFVDGMPLCEECWKEKDVVA